MKEIKNNLPKYWVVKLLKEEQQLFRRTVIPYLNNAYSETWRGSNINWFYGFDGNDLFNGTNTWFNLRHFKNNPTVLTLQEFIELSKPIEEFKLPKDWVLKVTSETVDVINKWKQTTKWKNHAKQYAYVRYDGAGISSDIAKKYSEITFEQFKKYVLKETKMYSIEEVKTNPKIIVYLDSEEEWDQLCKTVGFKITPKYYGKHCHSLYKGNHSYTSSQTDVGAYDKDCIIITLNQIKINMDKKIIGYKLIKPNMYKAASMILYGNTEGNYALYDKTGCSFTDREIEKLREAGVLDIWFAPVYQEEEKFKVGDIVVITVPIDDKISIDCIGDIGKITAIDDSKVPYKIQILNKNNIETKWCRNVRRATPEEIESIKTKSFTFGDFKITVKKDRIVIEGKGNISMDDFNSVVDAYEDIIEGFGLANSEYIVSFNIATVNVGCVKDIPIEAITTINNYLKAIK